MIVNTHRYRNLADWSAQDWQTLNIHLFIVANFNRYCSGLLKKVGTQHLPSDAKDSMSGLFCDVAFKPLTAIHQKHLDAVGERRNQIMLGTLKTIAQTRMVEALIREFPAYTSLDQIEWEPDMEPLAPECQTVSRPTSRTVIIQFSAGHHTENEAEENPASFDDHRQVMRIEALRSHLTPSQYQHLRYAICEGMSPTEIAQRTGHSPANVRIMLQNARRKMLALVPEHLQATVEDCLYRT